jgi:HAT1-interacting factor 1
VLDLARVLFLRQLQEAPERDGDPQDLKYLKERLADTYDLQAEISLEGERFPLAVEDLKAALELKMTLFPRQSSLIAEAHYKLSLALEFSSLTEQTGLGEEDEGGAHAKIDRGMRLAAAREMEAAIGSCKLRMKEEEAKLEAASSSNDDSVKPGAIRRNIEDVKEIVNDMEQRVDLTDFASCDEAQKLIWSS